MKMMTSLARTVWCQCSPAARCVMLSVMCDHDMSRQVLTSLVVALLVDNEMLSYSEPLSRIWPE